MQELKDRIVKEGKVLPGNIIKVDGFLNHRIDTELMAHIAEEFGKHFNMDEVTMILTAEASGIALSANVAQHFHKPKIIAKNEVRRVLTVGLAQLKNTFAGQAVSNYHEIMAGAVLAIIPVGFLFLIYQKYMMTGYSKAAMK